MTAEGNTVVSSRVKYWRARTAHCSECGCPYETSTPAGIEFNAEGIVIDDKQIRLSLLQDAMLRALLRVHGRIVSGDALNYELYGDDEEDDEADAVSRRMELVLRGLRAKLQDTRITIRNREGMGYYTVVWPADADGSIKERSKNANQDSDQRGNPGGVSEGSDGVRSHGGAGGSGGLGQQASLAAAPAAYQYPGAGFECGGNSRAKSEPDYYARAIATREEAHNRAKNYRG